MTGDVQDDRTLEVQPGVLCRCGHALTESDLYFCGYCGVQVRSTGGRRQAPAAVTSGRRAALAALASERNGVPAEPATDRLVLPARPAALVPARPVVAPSGADAVPAVERADAPTELSVDGPPAGGAEAPAHEVAPEGEVAPGGEVAPVGGEPSASGADEAVASSGPGADHVAGVSAARTARSARTTRAGRPARVARGGRATMAPTAVATVATAAAAPSEAAPPGPAPAPAPPSPAPAAPAPATPPAPASAAPAAVGGTPAPPTPSPSAAPDPADGVAAAEPRTEPESGGSGDEPAAEPRRTILGRRTWPAWVGVTLVVGTCAARTALGLVVVWPGFLSWIPIVLVAVLALAKVARFSIGLVGVATVAVTTWGLVDHLVSTARLQSLGYDTGPWAAAVPALLAAVGTIPLAAVLCGLLDGHVRREVRGWMVPPSGLHTLRAAVAVLAALAALFPVARSFTAEPAFGVLAAARDQVLVAGYPTPGQVADRMQAMSVAQGRPVSVTCSYAPPDVEPRPSYRCVAVTLAGSDRAEVHDGIESTGLPDGSYTCVDLTPGVLRRLC